MDFPCFQGDNPLDRTRQLNKYFELAPARYAWKIDSPQIYIIGRADNSIRSAKLAKVDISW